METSRYLAASVTPVVLISACGLIILALYNRLAAILARLRSIHQQKLEVLKELGGDHSQRSHNLLVLLDSQIEKVTIKAKAIQKGLYCLLSAVVAFLCCSLFSAVAVQFESFGNVALAMHFVGLCLFVTGIGWALRELGQSIVPLDEETTFLEMAYAVHVDADERPEVSHFKIAR